MQIITIEEPDEQLDELERQLKEQLAHLQQLHQRSIWPIVEQLTRIHNYRKRRYVVVADPAVDPASITCFLNSEERSEAIRAAEIPPAPKTTLSVF